MTLIEFLTARIDEDEAAARNDASPFHPVGGIIRALNRSDSSARALREVEAKRAILNEPYLGDGYERVYRALASVYADHPDYREEWKP